MQQLKFDGGYKSEFMIVALIIVVVMLFTMSVILDRKNILTKIKEGIPYGAVKGLSNGIVNLLVMVISAMIPTAILFPTVSGGGLVLGFFIAVFIYREKLSLPQTIGYAVGTASVVLLNL
jgi:multidrug transporter EmrE-like cation transporter